MGALRARLAGAQNDAGERREDAPRPLRRLGPGATRPRLGVDAVAAYGEGSSPPPTPNIPDNTPTSPPSPRRRKALTETSAIGR